MEQKSQRKYNLKRDVCTDHPIHVFGNMRGGLFPLVDLRPKCPSVYDQGQLGSCTANAIGAAYEFDQVNHHTQAFGKIVAFHPSRLFIYYNERAKEGTIPDDNGAAIEDGVKSVSTQGVCPETMWPYDITKFTIKPPASAYAYAKNCHVTKFKKLNQDAGQLKTCLASGYPIIFGMIVYQSMESDVTARTGMVSMPQQNEQNLGGHAVLIVGYDDNKVYDDSTGAKGVFIVRNSWGTTWGDKGYFYLPQPYVLDPNLCSDFWVFLTVTRDL
jgi:C1A family cysteine protease